MKEIIPISVTVITGFLGSGKTTLLSSILKNNALENVAVIINEFGEVGLDHMLIEKSHENIIELQNGCICCTIRGDLERTLIDLFNKLSKGQINSFSHVIIETTGLADPVPIIHTLMTSIDLIRIYVLDGVITVVDAKNGEDTLNMQQESVKQIALAESIIISKIDLVNTTKKNLLIDQLKAINPSAKIFAGSYGNVNLSELFGFNAYDPYRKSKDVKEWLSAEKIEESNHHHHHNIDVNRHDENIEAFSLVSKKPVNMMAFGLFRDLLTAKMGSDLLRVKGIINIKDRDFPAVIHGVQHVFHPVQWLDEWPDRERETKLVFITRNIKKEEIEGLFNALMGLIDSKGLPGVVELI